MERLHQTHNSLRAYRPPVPPEAILGASERTTETLSGFITEVLVPHLPDFPPYVAADVSPLDAAWQVTPPQSPMPQWATRLVGTAGLVRPVINITNYVDVMDYGRGRLAADLVRRDVALGYCWPQFSRAFLLSALAPAKPVKFGPSFANAPASASPVVGALMPLEMRLPAPVVNLLLTPVAPDPVEHQEPVQDVVPFAEWLLRLPRVAVRQIAPALPFSNAEPILVVLPALRLVRPLWNVAEPPVLRVAALRPLEPARAPLVQGTLILDRGVPQPGGMGMHLPSSIPAIRPELKLAEGRRYQVHFQGSAMQPADLEPADFMVLPADVAMPRCAVQPAAQPELEGRQNFVPDPAAIVALPFKPEVPALSPASPKVTTLSAMHQPLQSQPMLPKSNLEPMNSKPVGDVLAPETPQVGMGFSPALLSNRASAAGEHVWTLAAGFWKNAPRDLKLLMFAIPALLALAFHPALPKVSVAAGPSTHQFKSEISHNISSTVNTQLANVRQAVYERAAVALDEDFRSGLDDWASRGDATAGWSFDATGFVQPGPLALYRPSMNLSDYQVQFLGMIDQKALSWVVRAADFDNYYVVKLEVLKPGPVPTLGITRYAVIQGKAQDRVDTAIRMNARADMLYRISLDVHDDTFGLSVQGEMVDTWTDNRLTHGGIGFFSARGEKSRIRWVQVTHQYDMLGRLCAYLAPYETPTTNGSW